MARPVRSLDCKRCPWFSRTQPQVFLVNVKHIYIYLPPKLGITIWAEVQTFLGVMINVKLNVIGLKSFVNFKIVCIILKTL